MNKIKFISLAASLSFAMAFTFSCSLDDGDSDNPSSSSVGGSSDPSSSSVGGDPSPSSSSVGSSSSSSDGGEPAPSDILFQDIVLSYADKSYADIDANPVATYNEANALSLANIEKIDLFAYNRSTAGDKIYTPFTEDLDISENFWEWDDEEETYTFLGEYSFLYSIPPDVVGFIEEYIETAEDFLDLLEIMEPILEEEDEEYISIVPNAAFLVITKEGAAAIVIKSKGTRTVTLSITKPIPE